MGNYRVGDLDYDFRIEGELKDVEEIKHIPVLTPQGSIYLSDVAEVKKILSKDVVRKMGVYHGGPFDYISLGIHKTKGANIFFAEHEAKRMLDKELQKTKYEGIEYVSVYDL